MQVWPSLSNILAGDLQNMARVLVTVIALFVAFPRRIAVQMREPRTWGDDTNTVSRFSGAIPATATNPLSGLGHAMVQYAGSVGDMRFIEYTQDQRA